eukprot:Nk52_evm24s2391 gene=Nk52_evmTU24s2391
MSVMANSQSNSSTSAATSGSSASSATASHPSSSSYATNPHSAEQWCLGMCIQATTTLGETLIGEVFAYDVELSLLVLKDVTYPTSNPNSSKENYRLIRTDFIQKFVHLRDRDSKNPPLVLQSIDIGKVRHRESQAIKQATANQLRMGVGVSDYAQLTYDLLNKTLPCRWKKDKIIVMDEVIVSAPYGMDNIHGKDQISVNRVRKVLEGERKRYESAQSANNSIENGN